MKTLINVLPPLGSIFLVAISIFLFFITPCYAIDVTLKWDASPGADHYVVYWRTSSQSYDVSRIVDVGTDTTYHFSATDDTYYFVVRAVDVLGRESLNSREVCVLGPGSIEAGYDRGWAITGGDLRGFKVMYDSSDPTPTLGSSSDIPALDLPDVSPLGSPLYLQPSGTHFSTPVKIYIPCPGYSDLGGTYAYYFDDLEAKWLLADDTDDWIVADSFEEHYETDPITVAIKVKHFSGAQAGVPSNPSASPPTSSVSDSSGGGGGCFIDTAALRSNGD